MLGFRQHLAAPRPGQAVREGRQGSPPHGGQEAWDGAPGQANAVGVSTIASFRSPALAAWVSPPAVFSGCECGHSKSSA